MIRNLKYHEVSSVMAKTPCGSHVSDLSCHAGFTVTDSQGFSPYSMYPDRVGTTSYSISNQTVFTDNSKNLLN